MVTASRKIRRRKKSGLSEESLELSVVCGLIGLTLALWAALALGSWWASIPVRGNPAEALAEVAKGRRPWPWQSTVVAIAIAIPIGVGGWYARKFVRSRPEIDAVARTMQRSQNLVGARGESAARLMKDAPDDAQTKGARIGATVDAGVDLFAPLEMGVTVVAGTRSGKTTAWAIPWVLEAPGPMVATANKPDLLEHTRYGREQRGHVWLLDLQAAAGQYALGFWWNPLRYITELDGALELISFFVSASRDNDSRVDSYFDGGAQKLAALYILASACVGGDLLHVLEWLGRDQDDTPQLILYKHGHDIAAQRIRDIQSVTSRQRDGLFDMARRFLDVLTIRIYAKVVTPPSRKRIAVSGNIDQPDKIVINVEQLPVTHELPEFDPLAFVTSHDSLYALSMEGPASSTPLTTALVGQIIQAGRRTASRRPDGRLAVPMFAILDEAANCAKIAELPSYYSYAGGQGILLFTFLQVLEQGKKLWGLDGLKTMLNQSVQIYGGGVGDIDYLRDWVALVGHHDVADRSRRIGHGNSDTSYSWRSESILDESDLAALDGERAIVRYPRNKPILIVQVPWWETPHRGLVEQSLALYAGTPAPDAPTIAKNGDSQNGTQP
ncbi:TraM recognition domain-containing protein [Nocardia sp. NBC_00565]|uniref:type IV secretory system conjugative DNA transfer family protein n=1 Tax=Nocardia sp. NBC_00565 TaxID=2975993 RepID=UPI002E7FCC2D|nr:TraM recognition domain-containing protein [Nocardia sp. NBC_00565]WUC02043.1 TraM recognition domain-containing protein [Nocardia sp. NBC_00565]